MAYATPQVKLAAPPSRYRIVEKDRRLIVIDTLTGQRNASADLPTMADLARTETVAAPAAPRPSSTSAPISTPRTKRQTGGPATPNAVSQARLIALVIAAIAVVAVLFLSGLWIAVVIALLIPQVRTPMLEVGRKTLKAWLAP